jgi:type II secretory pathway component PulJ
MMLLELLVAIAFVSLLATLSMPLFRSMLQEMGRGTQTVQTDRTLNHMLERLQKDAEGARSLAMRRSEKSSMLAIGPEGDGASYEFRDGKVVRYSGDGNVDRSWEVPCAVVEWRAWPSEGAPKALEVRTAVAEDWPGHTVEKLSRTHLFFLALAGGGNP